MTDMNAFERQVAHEILLDVGPERPLDAMAVVRDVKSRDAKWSFGSTFGAAKLLVAGGIVAVFGGFLLAGMLTQPGEESTPAAVSASPEATAEADLLPGVDMVTEEIEPGVFRVLSDGTDDDLSLGSQDPDAPTQVVAGQDGSVWILDQSSLLRLGAEDWVGARQLDEWEPDFSVAPDGTLWARGADRDGAGSRQILSLSDGEWTAYDLPDHARATSIDVAADGDVWATWAVEWDGDGCTDAVGFGLHGAQVAVARLADGRWFEERFEPGTVFEDASLSLGPDGPEFLDVKPCGEGGLPHRRQDDGWQPADILGEDRLAAWSGFGPLEIGSDGTAWAWAELEAGGRLLRMTDGAWERFGDEEPVPWVVGNQTWGSSMTVSADGRLWLALGGGSPESGVVALDVHRESIEGVVATLDGLCPGLLSFDGAAWTHHLAGACVTHVSAAPSGNVWATVEAPGTVWLDDWLEDPKRAARSEEGAPVSVPAGLYVVTTEAVTEADEGSATR